MGCDEGLRVEQVSFCSPAITEGLQSFIPFERITLKLCLQERGAFWLL